MNTLASESVRGGVREHQRCALAAADRVRVSRELLEAA
jgi:hypothetical protein